MKKTIYAALALMLGTAGLHAQTPATDAYSKIESQIVANNPDLRSLLVEDNAERLSDRADNVLTGPEADFEYLAGPRDVRNRWNVSVTQSFDWPGAYGARSAAANARGNARAAMLQAQTADLRLKSRMLLIQAMGIRQEQQLLGVLTANMQEMLTATETALQHGQATKIDQAKLRFELISLREQLDGCERRLSDVRRQLIALNGGQHVDLSTLTDYPAQQLLTEQAYIDAFEAGDPYARASQAELQANSLQQRADRLAALPGFKAGYVHAFEEGSHFNGLTVGVSLPSWSPKARLQASQARAAVIEAKIDAYGIERRAAIRTELADAKRMQGLIDSYGDVIKSDDYVNSLIRLRNAGQITTLAFVTETNYYLDIYRRYLTLLCDYNLTLASLNRYQ